MRNKNDNWLVLVPAIVFDHVCQFNDELSLLVLLTGLKSMLLYVEGGVERYKVTILSLLQ